MNYQDKQDELHKEATRVLEDLNLIDTLSKAGEVDLVGSYPLQLMTWKDIDIEVIGPPLEEKALEVLGRIFGHKNTYNIKLQDFRKSVNPDRPQGIYLMIHYLDGDTLDDVWKIDIWFLPERTDAYDIKKWVEENVNEDSRERILKIKSEMREKLKNGKKTSGFEVYEAVLEHDVKNLEEFKEYLGQKRKK